MLLKHYQDVAMITNTYPRVTRPQHSSVGVAHNLPLPYTETLPVYPAMAMCGEIAELADKILGGYRVQAPYLNEIGDVLWYVTAAAGDLGFTLCDIVSTYKPYPEGIETFRMFEHNVSSCSDDLQHRVLRLVVCAGWFAERTKKAWRDGTPFDRLAARRELCVVLGTLAQVATLFYGTLEQAAELNLAKVTSRRARGTMAGAGDDR
jgi:hypothetical protein